MTVQEIVELAKIDGWEPYGRIVRHTRFPFVKYHRTWAQQLSKYIPGRSWPDVVYLHEVVEGEKYDPRFLARMNRHNQKFLDGLEEAKTLAPVLEFCT